MFTMFWASTPGSHPSPDQTTSNVLQLKGHNHQREPPVLTVDFSLGRPLPSNAVFITELAVYIAMEPVYTIVLDVLLTLQASSFTFCF